MNEPESSSRPVDPNFGTELAKAIMVEFDRHVKKSLEKVDNLMETYPDLAETERGSGFS